MKSKQVIGAIFLTVAAGIWGGMFVVVKAVVGTIPPIQLVWLRYLVGALALFAIARVKRIKWHWDRRNVGLIILIGLIGDTLSIVTQETGTWLASAQLGSVITTATPAFMVLFSWPLLKRRPQLGDWLSLVLAGLGVVAIVGLQFGGRSVLIGAGCLFMAGLSWALMSVLVELVDTRYDTLQVTFLAAVVAIVCLTPVVISQHKVLSTINWGQPNIWLSILYLGVVSTALAFVLWNQGLRLMHSSLAGLFFLFQPVIGAILGWVFLGEALSWGLLVGLVLILGSIWTAIRFDQ